MKNRTMLCISPAAEKTKSARIVSEHETRMKFSVLSRKS